MRLAILPRTRCGEALTRAIVLDATVRAELAKFARNEAIDPALGKAITSLFSELERLIDETEAEVARAAGRSSEGCYPRRDRSIIRDHSSRGPGRALGIRWRNPTSTEGMPSLDRALWRAAPGIDPTQATPSV